jgi:hypothetical protein
VWKTLQLGYRFFLLVASYPAITRIRIQETIDELSGMDDPKKYHSLLSCNNDKWCVVNIKDTDLLLAIIIHYNEDPIIEYRNCIELVNIINPKLL